MNHNDLHEGRADDGASGLDVNTDENVQGTSHLNDPLTDESELDRLKEEIEALKDRNLRQAAEFDNFRRRSAKERIELSQTAGKEVISELLDVLDDSDRAQKNMMGTDDLQQIREGVQLVFAKLRSALQSRGLRPMDCVQKDFNVDEHEAVTEIDAGPEMKGKVVAEVQKGYFLNDRIIRYAKVVVGK